MSQPKPVQLTAENLEAIGGSRWQRGEHDRVYFDRWAAFAGLEVSRYKSGSIASAVLDGEPISNGEASKIFMAVRKVYVDLVTGEIVVDAGYASPRKVTCAELVTRIRAGIREAAAAIPR
ncbi:hypothetical protein GCM10022221_68430 [Actinocorallia aurea]